MTRLYDLTVEVYELMMERSEPNEVDEPIFKGYLSKLMKEAGASSSYYSSIRTFLISPPEDPCIEIRQRGNRSQLTEILLRHPPPAELYEDISHADLTSGAVDATMVVDLGSRVSVLESWRESMKGVNILEVLRDYEKRILALEGRESGKTTKATTSARARTTNRKGR